MGRMTKKQEAEERAVYAEKVAQLKPFRGELEGWTDEHIDKFAEDCERIRRAEPFSVGLDLKARWPKGSLRGVPAYIYMSAPEIIMRLITRIDALKAELDEDVARPRPDGAGDGRGSE